MHTEQEETAADKLAGSVQEDLVIDPEKDKAFFGINYDQWGSENLTALVFSMAILRKGSGFDYINGGQRRI